MSKYNNNSLWVDHVSLVILSSQKGKGTPALNSLKSNEPRTTAATRGLHPIKNQYYNFNFSVLIFFSTIYTLNYIVFSFTPILNNITMTAHIKKGLKKYLKYFIKSNNKTVRHGVAGHIVGFGSQSLRHRA